MDGYIHRQLDSQLVLVLSKGIANELFKCLLCVVAGVGNMVLGRGTGVQGEAYVRLDHPALWWVSL